MRRDSCEAHKAHVVNGTRACGKLAQPGSIPGVCDMEEPMLTVIVMRIAYLAEVFLNALVQVL